MKNILIIVLLNFPFFCNAQLQVKDTTIKGELFKIYPFKLETENKVPDFNGFETIKNLSSSLPSVPSIPDTLPDGNYIMLNKNEAYDGRSMPNYSLNDHMKEKENEPFIYAKFTIRNGVKNGICIFYNEKRKIIGKGNYVSDIKQDGWEYYSPMHSYRINYINGLMQGSIIVKEKYVVICKSNLKDERVNGEYFEYYNNGQLKIFTKFVEHNAGNVSDQYIIMASEPYDSIYSKYHKNGKLKYSQLCRNGYYHCNLKEFNSNGRLTSERKMIKREGEEYIIQCTDFFPKSGRPQFSELKTTYKEHGSLFPVNNVQYNEIGDTISIENAINFKKIPIKTDYILLQSRFYNKGKITEEKFYHSYFNYFNSYLQDAFRNSYYPTGKPKYITQINYNKLSESFLMIKSAYDSSGNFEVKNYSTYRIHYIPRDLKGEAWDTSFEMIPGSDTMRFFMNRQALTRTIFYPIDFQDYNKLSCSKKIRNIFRSRGNACVPTDFPQFFDWYGVDFTIVEMTGKQFYDQYKIRGLSYEDTATFLLPVKTNNTYKLSSNYRSFDLIDGKLSGAFDDVDRNRNFYINGIKEGPCSNYNSKGYYKNGLRNGQFIEFSIIQDGEASENYKYFSIYKIKHYLNDTLHGSCVSYDYATGQPSIFTNYEHGKINGPYIEINPINNDTLVHTHFVNGLINGKLERYGYKESGEVTQYRGPAMPNEIRIEKPKSLLKIYEFQMYNSLYQGKQTIYSKSGYPLLEIYFEKPTEIGQVRPYEENIQDAVLPDINDIQSFDSYHTYLYKTGIIAEEGKQESERKVGVWKSYHEDGKLYKVCDYHYMSNLDFFPDAGDFYFRASITTYHANGKIYEKGYIRSVESKYDCNQERDIDDEEVLYTEIYDSTGKSLLNAGTGEINITYPNGQRKARGKQVNGFREGFWIFFDPNGNPIQAGNYIHSEKDGRWLAGDLRGFHFIDNQCFSEDTDAELIKLKAENNLEIEEHFFKEGVLISSNSVRVEKK